MPSFSCRVGEELRGNPRLDRYVAEELKLLRRSQIKAKNLHARLNGREVKISRPLKTGDLLELSWDAPDPGDLIPEDLPLTILYEDDRVVVINKAQGMVVHPGAGNPAGTLANALLYRRLHRSGGGEGVSFSAAGFRPGIVHRLDKDTSGVIIAAYDDEALAFLADQFKNRRVRKIYAALVRGIPPQREGRIESRVTRDSRDRKKFTLSTEKGKPALTFYRVLRTWPGYSLLALRPRTGRTHQLRLHLRSLGCPILGDPLYGSADPRFPGATLALHAKSLTLVLPGREGDYTFKAPLPPRFTDLLGKLRRLNP
jgi:23S rRNA pseudouridine1911/1915/1917 synthase